MALTLPSSSVQTSSGSVVGGGSLIGGLVAAFAGSFPTGPVFDPKNPATCLMSSKEAGAAIFGSEYSYSDLSGWSGPPSLATFFAEAEGARPQALLLRAGTTQASIAIATASTIAAALVLGGADGNGTTFTIAAPVNGAQAITITPPTGNVLSLKAEAYSVATGATWQTVANLINPQSKLVSLTIATADQATGISATLVTYTPVGGTAGANATAAQINTAVDQLTNLLYSIQPVQVCVPLFSDGPATGVALHALGDALTAQANGLRFQVIGSASTAHGQGSAAVSSLLSLGTTLVPSENGGDSGRCTLIGNNYPMRRDPATGNTRLYPGYVAAAGYAAKVASLNPYSTPRTHHRFSTLTFQEGYLPADLQTLFAGTGGQGAVLTATPYGMLTSEATTAIQASYRRNNAVQTCEDVWTADLANLLNQAAVGNAATAAGGQRIDNLSLQSMRGYVQGQVMQGYTLDVQQDSSDFRNWEVDAQWNPILSIDNVILRAQLVAAPVPGGSVVTTF